MISVILTCTFSFLTIIVFGCLGYLIYFWKVIGNAQRKRTPGTGIRLGFFHPYCNDGGGGERVLWTAIRSILEKHSNTHISVYTGDLEYSPTEILQKIHKRFNIQIPPNVEFIYLHKRKYIEPNSYPIFTLLGQSLGSILLGMEALLAHQPDVFIDTMGYAFTYPIFRYIGRCKVACYTHYPIITSEMCRRVASRVSTYNNRSTVANSPFLTAGKLIYYKIFAWMYKKAGRCADVVLVNSSWTEEHVNELWSIPLRTHRVFPPCDVTDLLSITRIDSTDNSIIKLISVGQFRPEKNHPLMLRAMYQLRQLVTESIWDRVQLVLVGACRNEVDKERVKDMEDLCKHLSLENNVVFKINISYEDLKKELTEATIGVHAMWNEHFGIGVVECMAAGLITIAHRSGGPLMDIIVEAEGCRNGFLAAEDEEYAHAMATILRMTKEQKDGVILAARSSVKRFSAEEFEMQFLRAVDPLFKNQPM